MQQRAPIHTSPIHHHPPRPSKPCHQGQLSLPAAHACVSQPPAAAGYPASGSGIAPDPSETRPACDNHGEGLVAKSATVGVLCGERLQLHSMQQRAPEVHYCATLVAECAASRTCCCT